MTKEYKVIPIEDYGVVVDTLNVTQYPQTVLEKLTTGEWMFWQIDNPNDIDNKNQMNIVGTVGNKRFPNVPLIELVDDVEGIARRLCTEKREENIQIFIEGYKAKTNGYSEEDMYGLLKFAYQNPSSGDYKTVIKNYIQSLQKQPIPKIVALQLEQLCIQTGRPCGFPCYSELSCLKSLFIKITNKETNTITAIYYKK